MRQKCIIYILVLLVSLCLFSGCGILGHVGETDTHDSVIDQSSSIATEAETEPQNTMILNTELIMTTMYGTTRFVLTYDEYGRQIKSDTFEGSTLITTATLTYDGNGYQNSMSTDYHLLTRIKKEEWTNTTDGKPLSGTVTTTTNSVTNVVSYSYTYDNQGRELSYVKINADNKPLHNRNYQYTDENNSYIMTEKRENLYKTETTCTFDAQGCMTEQIVTTDGHETTRTLYDIHGNEVEITTDGKKVTCRNIYIKDQLSQVEQLDEDGDLMQKINYTYDENGNIIELVITDASGTQLQKTEYRYTLCVVKES